jgi:hypothetical protein
MAAHERARRAGRRSLLGAAAGALFFPPLFPARAATPPLPPPFPAVPESGALTFRIVREGLMIGTQALTFTPPGSVKPDPHKPKTLRLTVRIFTEVTFKPTPLTLYQFSGTLIEEWDGGKLHGFTAESVENGIHRRLRGERGPGGSLWVKGPLGRLAVPPDAIPATFWNPQCLDSPLIDPIFGRVLTVQVADRGMTRIEIANGSELDVHAFALSGDFPAELWYVEQPARRFAGMRRPGGDGVPLVYELL